MADGKGPDWFVTPGLKATVDEFLTFLESFYFHGLERQKPLMIIGGSGVGKSMFTSIFEKKFKKSPSGKDKIIIRINIAALHKPLIAAELFGYVKGAFTGANQKTTGFLKKADGGLLIIEEIGELQKPEQAKLLTFLEDGYYYPLGSREPENSDVLILGTTHRPRESFRGDFWNRFTHFHVPSFYERRLDVLYYFKRMFPDLFHSLSDFEILLFLSYNWPGNAREIENIGRNMQSMDRDCRSIVQGNQVPKYFSSSFLYKPSTKKYHPFCFSRYLRSPFSRRFMFTVNKYVALGLWFNTFLEEIGFCLMRFPGKTDRFDLSSAMDEMVGLEIIQRADLIEKYSTPFDGLCRMLCYDVPLRVDRNILDLAEGDSEGISESPRPPYSEKKLPGITRIHNAIFEYRTKGNEIYKQYDYELVAYTQRECLDGVIGSLMFKIGQHKVREHDLDTFFAAVRSLVYQQAIEEHNGNIKKAAEDLGVPNSTFQSRLKKLSGDDNS